MYSLVWSHSWECGEPTRGLGLKENQLSHPQKLLAINSSSTQGRGWLMSFLPLCWGLIRLACVGFVQANTIAVSLLVQCSCHIHGWLVLSFSASRWRGGRLAQTEWVVSTELQHKRVDGRPGRGKTAFFCSFLTSTFLQSSLSVSLFLCGSRALEGWRVTQMCPLWQSTPLCLILYTLTSALTTVLQWDFAS